MEAEIRKANIAIVLESKNCYNSGNSLKEIWSGFMTTKLWL